MHQQEEVKYFAIITDFEKMVEEMGAARVVCDLAPYIRLLLLEELEKP